MTEDRIGRINELAKKNKAEGLTAEELAERAVLREEYLASIRGSLEAQLGNIYLVDETGDAQPLQKKED